jgi:hypothetical protein
MLKTDPDYYLELFLDQDSDEHFTYIATQKIGNVFDKYVGYKVFVIYKPTSTLHQFSVTTYNTQDMTDWELGESVESSILNDNFDLKLRAGFWLADFAQLCVDMWKEKQGLTLDMSAFVDIVLDMVNKHPTLGKKDIS